MAKALRGSRLNRARKAAHDAFDPLWKSAHLPREAAYRWLALKLALPLHRAHIGQLDIEQCQRLVVLCGEFSLDDPEYLRALDGCREQNRRRLRDERKHADQRRRRARSGWRARAKAKRSIFGVLVNQRRKRAKA